MDSEDDMQDARCETSEEDDIYGNEDIEEEYDYSDGLIADDDEEGVFEDDDYVAQYSGADDSLGYSKKQVCSFSSDCFFITCFYI